MDISLLQSIVMGCIQGMSEFLPVSSTAHLVLAPFFFGWNDPGLTFDVALHIGTLFAVVGYFWKDWLRLFRAAFSSSESSKEYPPYFFWYLVAATFPAAIAGFFLESLVAEALRTPLVVAFNLAFFGFVLYVADRFSGVRQPLAQSQWTQIGMVGIAQILALVPGVSRSGITITAARLLGFSRNDAARVSFLLSTPIIFGAALSQVSSINHVDTVLLSGIVVSALCGYMAIAFLLKWINRVGYGVFFWYRLLLAGLIILFTVYRQ